MLDGRLIEHWSPSGAQSDRPGVEHLDEGTVAYRPARHAHRLYLGPRRYPGCRPATPLTLFCFGPRRRAWGFWVPDGQGAWYLERHPTWRREA